MATLDFEASGLAQESYPIEVGVCLQEGDATSFLINPLTADSWVHWDPEAESIHQIARADLESQGEDVTTVCQQLNQLLGDYDAVLCDSHWDLFWLGRLYRAAHMRPSFTLFDVSNWLAQHQYDVAAYEAGFVSLGPAKHRAADDAVQIFQALKLSQLGASGNSLA
uniref:hypothetical protein n=1 Tax=Thaumasiovibrio occultus TaxID=1891184 RepID=UPI000B350215|nr:hypothetical protein [Thaumasiovibrio occultus]